MRLERKDRDKRKALDGREERERERRVESVRLKRKNIFGWETHVRKLSFRRFSFMPMCPFAAV